MEVGCVTCYARLPSLVTVNIYSIQVLFKHWIVGCVTCYARFKTNKTWVTSYPPYKPISQPCAIGYAPHVIRTATPAHRWWSGWAWRRCGRPLPNRLPVRGLRPVRHRIQTSKRSSCVSGLQYVLHRSCNHVVVAFLEFIEEFEEVFWKTVKLRHI